MGTNRSVMKHDFSRAPGPQIPRSSFNRSHGLKTTFDSGLLVPIFLDEALPADDMSLRLTAFGRLATPIHPVMDNLFAETFFFAVPYRLLWSNWQKFNGEQAKPSDSTDFVTPKVTAPASGFEELSLADYFGLPTKITNSPDVTAFAFRAMALIWNEWFRDQNLQDSVEIPLGDGPDDMTLYPVFRRGKRHDYFSSALPWPQKSQPVPIPFSGSAPISGLGTTSQATAGAPAATVYETGGTSRQYDDYFALNSGTFIAESAGSPAYPAIFAKFGGPGTTITATINDLRQAFQIQKLYERDARGGTRYTEILRSHFGVISPDARLQRPEFLGGGSSPIMFNAVAQTSALTGEPTPKGDLSAYATLNLQGHGFTKSFTEHCLIIGLINVRADLNYQQGVNRMWFRETRFDFYWPALSHLGEQEVFNKEIYLSGVKATDDAIFGYQERYAEYRYKPSLVTGKFRSNADQTLDSWHLAQNFTELPALNASFIEDKPPVARILAVQNQPEIILDCYFNYRCARPMPMYGVPGMIDHF